MSRRILACGSRRYTDEEAIRRELLSLCATWADVAFAQLVIIHGGARGADSLAEKVAAELGCATEVYPADWRRFGRGAGPQRNKQMLERGHPDYVLAFPLGDSPGTMDLVSRARSRRIQVRIVLAPPAADVQ